MKGLNAFASDVTAQENGIWSSVGDMEFLIAKTGNDSWKREMIKLETKQYGSMKRRKEKRDADKDVIITLKCLARTCILDWKGVTLDDKNVKFSVAKCEDILTDKRFESLAIHLLELASDEERFMELEIQEDEEAVKN